MKNSRFLFLALMATGAAGVTVAISPKTIVKATSGYTVQIDTTYLTSAVVSETLIDLTSKVVDGDGNYDYTKSVTYSLMSGSDLVSLQENKLHVKAAGSFAIKAALSDDETVYTVVDCKAYALTFSNIRIQSKFDDVITVYTQPIALSGTCDVAGIDYPEDVHKQIDFAVVSGPADIYTGNYLRFSGVGEVVLKAYSHFDKSVYITKTINVVDPDSGKDVSSSDSFTQGDLTSLPSEPSSSSPTSSASSSSSSSAGKGSGGGCGGDIGPTIMAVLAAGVGVGGLTLLRRKNEKD